MAKSTLLERIRVYAEAGKVSASMKLWKAQIARLTEKGFDVTIYSPAEHEDEFYCKVSWENPKGHAASLMLATSAKAMRYISHEGNSRFM